MPVPGTGGNFILNEKELDNLYNWIDAIPLNRNKKNIYRDFSDGVLVARTVALYLPRLVELHNYAESFNVRQKKVNWETLNRKVFAKIGIKISDKTIQMLLDAKQGAIEQVLWDLRKKLMKMNPNPPYLVESQTPTPIKPKEAVNPSRYVAQPIPKPRASVPVSAPNTARAAFNKTSVEKAPIQQVKKINKVESPRAPQNPVVTQAFTYNQARAPEPLPSGEEEFAENVPLNFEHEPENQIQGENEDCANNNFTKHPVIIFNGMKMIDYNAFTERNEFIQHQAKEMRTLIQKLKHTEQLIHIKDNRIEDYAIENLRLRTAVGENRSMGESRSMGDAPIIVPRVC